MGRHRLKTTGRRESGRFIAIPLNILQSQQYVALSSSCVKLLIDLFAQFNGRNNGDLCATWTLMEKRGWRSRDTLGRAIKDLLGSGFIMKTRQGEKGHENGHRKPTLYAVTWLGIDECGGKLDVRPSPVPLNLWKGKSA